MSKISELSDGGSLTSTDFLIAVRSGGNVKVQMDQINVDQVDLGDNEFIRLGNSQDLTLVHTSTQSIINQAGIGDLLIQKAGATKLTINSSGIGVAGNVTASRLITGDGIQDAGSGGSESVFNNGQTTSNFRVATTGNANTLFVDGGSNNVGIGASSPSQKLHVDSGTTDTVALFESSGDANAYLVVKDSGSSGGAFFGANGTSTIIGTGGSTERMRIDSSGNVGIGTSSPAWGIQTGNFRGSASAPVFSGTSGDGFAFDYYNGPNPYPRHGSIAVIGAGTSTADMSFWTDSGSAVEERMRINSNGNVGIGTSSPTAITNYTTVAVNGTTGGVIDFENGEVLNSRLIGEAGGLLVSGEGSRYIKFHTNNTERMRIDASGNLLVGKTVLEYASNAGVILRNDGLVSAVRSDGNVCNFQRKGSDGDIILLGKDGTFVGGIGANGGTPYLSAATAGGVRFTYLNSTNAALFPCNTTGANSDATHDIGNGSVRFRDLYRSGSTISTSDRTMKQDERDLTEAEATVAQACKSLLKAFRFIDAVEKDGDGARIHFGIIAQDLQAAFETEGLDATKYAMFRPSTLTDDEGDEQVRLGVCYENLLAFIIAAI